MSPTSSEWLPVLRLVEAVAGRQGEDVRARAAGKSVIAGAAGQAVIAGAAGQTVIAGRAEQGIAGASADQLDMAQDMGALRTLFKPVEPAELLAAVGELLTDLPSDPWSRTWS